MGRGVSGRFGIGQMDESCGVVAGVESNAGGIKMGK